MSELRRYVIWEGVGATCVGGTFCGFADCCILNTTKETKMGESTRDKTYYETSVVRGEEMFRLWRADRPKVTKSWGRNCSGTASMRCLLTTGSKCDGWFSLLSDEYEPENGSLGNVGVFGVSGMSSDTSDSDVVELGGVMTVHMPLRFGVTGNEGRV